MAFLCPSRRGRQKKKKKEAKTPFLGRITGSASVDTLVRVGLEKQHGLSPDSRMRVTQDFMATIEDELSAHTGDIVYMLYKENDWIYVITEQGREGFLPYICVELFEDPDRVPPGQRQKKLRRPLPDFAIDGTDNSTHAEEGSDASSSALSHSQSSSTLHVQSNPLPKPARTLSIPDVISTNNHVDRAAGSRNTSDHGTHNQHSHLGDKDREVASSQSSLVDPVTEVKTFSKKPSGKLLVLFPFEGSDENDLVVERGEVVTALNKGDPLWVWVKRLNGQEGFVPSAYMCPFPEDLHSSSSESSNRQQSDNRRTPSYHDVRELTTLRHFTAQSADDISVERGQQVFADLANQIERDWLWVYAPSTGQYGYIPRDNIVWPMDEVKGNVPNRPP